jgi:hypothetical protein
MEVGFSGGSMKSHEAIQKAIDGKTLEHARALHLSSSLLHKWQEPCSDWSDSGSHNPLDRIETIINTSSSLGSDTTKALAPLFYLAARFRHVAVPLPTSKVCNKVLAQELIKAIEEFSILTRDSSVALEDGLVTKKEFRAIEDDGWKLIQQIAVFIVSCKEAAK